MTGRYELLGRIGAGGMGVVYEALDRERGQTVALKTIARPGVEDVYRLKREFRALADLGHPNLVTLYDLVVDGDNCFFTMELLDGEDLLSYVWPKKLGRANTDDDTLVGDIRTPAPTGEDTSDGVPVIDTAIVPTPCDVDRLRSALPQLCRGLHALHVAGKIHRDIKPSNIRVTKDGRVVLLDFGLVAELWRRSSGSELGGIVGTIPYMAPEQCSGDVPLTPAADWYALGTTLFLMVAGRLPFEGAVPLVVLKKQTEIAPSPSRYAHGVPGDIEELCRDLLAREPERRPGGRAILRRVGMTTDDAAILHVPAVSWDSGFGGRDAELAALDAALKPLERGGASVAVVRGRSGMGKTALVGRFFEIARARHKDFLVLSGRCFESEDLPYKAIDDLIDELSEWWREQSPGDAEALLPRDASLLPTLFPVLGRVPAVAEAPVVRAPADPQALRTRAFSALREVFQRIADRRRLVLCLDDVQWGDRDTTLLLADLLRAPDPPALLLVLATRDEGADDVVELARRMDAELAVIDVGPLSPEAALELASLQLGGDSDAVAARLVREAGGSPLFLSELTRYLQAHAVDDITGKGLDAMLAERIGELGPAARIIAQLVAVAGEPIGREVLGGAADLSAPELSRHLSLLRAQRIVRTSGAAGAEIVEPYHGRVREAVSRPLEPGDRARLHRALAVALEIEGSDEELARHWHGAGDIERAAGHARTAGERAQQKLAFDRAARLFAMALESDRWSASERLDLRIRLADCLADAGRPREAAEEFLAAAAAVDAHHGDFDLASGVELRRRAAGVLLQSGYVEEGLALTRDVLSSVGMHMPETPRRALASLLGRRAFLRLRGLGFRPRPEHELDPRELTRVDLCEGVSFGLALVDNVRAMDFATRFLHGALKLGETWRVSRALALETDLLAVVGRETRAIQLLARLERITEDLDTPAAAAQLLTTRGMIDFFLRNRFSDALAQLTEATEIYRAAVGRAGFELESVTLFRLWAMNYLGQIGELSQLVPASAEAADRAGNRHTAVTLQCAFPAAWLAALGADELEQRIDAALASWDTGGGYQLQHLFALCSRIDLAIFRGEPEAALPLVEAARGPLRRSFIDRPPLHAALLWSSIGRLALAQAAAAPPGSRARAQALARARRKARRLGRGALPILRAGGALLDAAAIELEGRSDDAIARYRSALSQLEALDFEYFAAAARDHLGRLIGGDEGAALRETSRERLLEQKVRDPDALLAMILPRPAAS